MEKEGNKAKMKRRVFFGKESQNILTDLWKEESVFMK